MTSIRGHFFKPAKLEPTEIRIAGLTVARGYTITLFAKGPDAPRLGKADGSAGLQADERRVLSLIGTFTRKRRPQTIRQARKAGLEWELQGIL